MQKIQKIMQVIKRIESYDTRNNRINNYITLTEHLHFQHQSLMIT